MSETAEEVSLPEELVPRTVTLLARGALVAVLALVLLAGGSVALVALALAFLDVERSDPGLGGWLALLAVVCGGVAAPVLAHAAPFAAFASSVNGSPRLGPVLRLSLSSSPRVLCSLLMSGTFVSSFGAAVVVAVGVALDERAPLVMRILFAAAGLFFLVTMLWLHGSFVLVEGARVALGLQWGRPILPRTAVEGTAAAAITVVPLLAVAGTALGPRVGVSVPLEAVRVAGALLVLGAHVVSCAAGVAVATREERAP